MRVLLQKVLFYFTVQRWCW